MSAAMFYSGPTYLRPGEQIDRVIDLTFVPNAPDVTHSRANSGRTSPNLLSSDLLLIGIQFGAELRW